MDDKSLFSPSLGLKYFIQSHLGEQRVHVSKNLALVAIEKSFLQGVFCVIYGTHFAELQALSFMTFLAQLLLDIHPQQVC